MRPSHHLPVQSVPRPDRPPEPRWDLSAPGGLVLRLAAAVREGTLAAPFLIRRAATDQALQASPERRHLEAVVSSLAAAAGTSQEGGGEPVAETVADTLIAWGGYLEARHALEAAARVMNAAMQWSPDEPELRLHAARVARKAGDAARARELYRRARGAEARPRVSRMAAVGIALLEPDAEEALDSLLRDAIRNGDREVAGVIHEERASLRRRRGDRTGALRDYGAACLRYPDAADRGRAAHAAADLLVAAGDPLAAREVLLEIGSIGLPGQWDLARTRLHSIARSTGDDLGARRWKGQARSGLVSLGPSRVRSGEESLRPLVSRWIDRARVAGR